MKRQLAQSLNALERVEHHLGSVYLEFKGVKKDYAEYLEMMITNAIQLRQHILKFWESAWGKAPDDFNVWR